MLLNSNNTGHCVRFFLSYGHDEYASLALRIKRDLEALGHEVWFDAERLYTGGDWERRIEQGLDFVSAVSGGRFLLLMTPHSVRRPDGYCLNELARAYGRNLPIIPVMVSTVEPPLSICRLQWLDMRQCFPSEQHEEQYARQFEQLVSAFAQKHVPSDGVQQRLLSYLQPITYDDLPRHLQRFTGREWVMNEVEEWLASSRRALWITGEAGVGKSALAAWLCEKRPEIAAFHFCRFGNADRADPRRALFSLAYQLSTQLPVYQDRLSASPLDQTAIEPNVRAVFDRLFVTPLADAVPIADKPHVLLIDALDEVTQNGANELASLVGSEFDRLPPWLRIIITSRPHEQAINSTLQALDPWKLDAGREENLDDIRKYLRRELRAFTEDAGPSDEMVERILAKSEGLFLYVSLIREELEKGRLSLARSEDFPQGLGAVYQQWFERYFPDAKTYRSECRPALEAICAAREPLPRACLEEALNWSDYKMDSLAEQLGSLFPLIGEDERMRPVHQSVRDWLTDRKRAGAYRVDLNAGEQCLADYCWRALVHGVSSEAMGYAARYLAWHLHNAGRSDELIPFLSDFFHLRKITGRLNQHVKASGTEGRWYTKLAGQWLVERCFEFLSPVQFMSNSKLERLSNHQWEFGILANVMTLSMLKGAELNMDPDKLATCNLCKTSGIIHGLMNVEGRDVGDQVPVLIYDYRYISFCPNCYWSYAQRTGFQQCIDTRKVSFNYDTNVYCWTSGSELQGAVQPASTIGPP